MESRTTRVRLPVWKLVSGLPMAFGATLISTENIPLFDLALKRGREGKSKRTNASVASSKEVFPAQAFGGSSG